MTARLLVIGLDAVEAPILERMAHSGRAPVLAELWQRGLSAAVRAECMDTLPGAIWQDIGTGRSAQNHGDYFPWRIHSGEPLPRLIDPTTHADNYYWSVAARSGRRVAVVDQPLVPTLVTVPATQVTEWHVHDQIWGRGSNPPDLIANLEARHAFAPVDRCDFVHGETRSGYEAFLDSMVHAVTVKSDMAIELLEGEKWDLFTIAFSEGHCTGHQLWHLQDPSSPLRPPDVGDRLANALEEVYAAIDAAVGRLMAAAGDQATTMVFTSHGMGAYFAGPQLLEPVLNQLGFGDPRRLPPWIRPVLPIRAIQRLIRRFKSLRRAAARTGTDVRGFHRPGVRAVSVGNNRVGGIRLSIAGREPHGEIRLEDVDAVIADISAELMALRATDSDQAVVLRVDRTDRLFGPDRHPDLPDLLVVFRHDLGELTSVIGPRVGRIDKPFRRPDYPRTGDHTANSRLWLSGPGVTQPGPVPDLRSIDIAPTILALLEVPVPDWVDGRPVEALRSATGPTS